VFALSTFLFIGLHVYVRLRLLKSDHAAWEDVRGVVQGLVGPLCYLVGAAAAWVYIPAAFVIYALTPIFYLTPPQGPGGAKNGR
jgi:hypothetical protein